MLSIFSLHFAGAQVLEGTIVDSETGETLIGALVEVEGSDVKAISDLSGNFSLAGLPGGACTLKVTYMGYVTATVQCESHGEGTSAPAVVISMTPDEQQLEGIVVTAEERRNTGAALMRISHESSVIVTGISAEEISRTQDSNAGEIIRRIPGVSLIEDKFVMVRGLSQRYNNVWMNGGAVPSSEADSRAFSFDLVPSSQIDNLTIIKSPAAEYPADYTGGFILITTKDVPDDNGFSISLGGNFNDRSYRNFVSYNAELRPLPGGINAPLTTFPGSDGIDLLASGLDNDWSLRHYNPVSDLKVSANLNHRWNLPGGELGLIAAANFSEEYRAQTDMQNNLFGAYDKENGRPNYLRRSVDDQYNDNVRAGVMLNLTFLGNNGDKLQFKNIFNRIDNARYTWREGVSAQSDKEKSAEYYFRSRNTYSGQLSGTHGLSDVNTLDWCAGYSYADRIIPDRRRYLVDDSVESGTFALNTGNDASREWTDLREHIMSASADDSHEFLIWENPSYIKAGVYGEYRTRRYATREFIYNWNVYDNTLPEGFKSLDPVDLLGNREYFGEQGIHLLEQLQMRNNYRGNNVLGAAYVSASLNFGDLELLAGLRFEHNDMELISNTRDYEVSERSRHYVSDDLFPSANLTWRYSDEQSLRLSYGRSINRPEFREVSSSVYYDFDLASSVQGNTELRNCYIDNVDLRWEYYPSQGEMITLALFFKHFDSPIEWTYTVSGGTDLIYSYKNALSANNYGVELDVRKDLSFIGLDNFYLSFNGALIRSRVNFEPGSLEQDRPMQGQSPYLVNAGLFYSSKAIGLDVSLLYNRIGKRIIGVGRSEGTSGSDDVIKVPDSYEMPRNSLDFNVSKDFGEHVELKLYMKNILGEPVVYKQFEQDVEQITRMYQPGRNIGMSVVMNF